MRHRVLVVEDDRNLRPFLQKALREEGYDVEVAESGDDGLARALAEPFDCVVLDRMLPAVDGMSVLRTMRERGVGTPVIMLTARGAAADRVGGLEAGADDYLAKPFDLAELLARVQALIRRARRAGDDAVRRVGQLTIDRTARRVTVGGRVVDLTAREYALLEFMSEHTGRTLSRARIAAAVWNYQFDPETNVVDVYVKYLRKKLAGLEDGTEIVTVRGVGYRLEGP
jgi:two-component system, OmpR family, response regulator